MRLFALVLILSAGMTALAEGWSSPSRLNLVFPATSSLRDPVAVSFLVQDQILRARFEVRAQSLNVKKNLAVGEYPYHFDVVELFVTVAGETVYPYFEFQVTPHNQTFTVKIEERGRFVNNVDVGLSTRAQITKTGWIAEMAIPLAALGWDGDPKKIVGNAFAIQGKGKSGRSYWSLNLPQQRRPNFHQPQFFRPLL